MGWKWGADRNARTMMATTAPPTTAMSNCSRGGNREQTGTLGQRVDDDSHHCTPNHCREQLLAGWTRGADRNARTTTNDPATAKHPASNGLQGLCFLFYFFFCFVFFLVFLLLFRYVDNSQYKYIFVSRYSVLTSHDWSSNRS